LNNLPRVAAATGASRPYLIYDMRYRSVRYQKEDDQLYEIRVIIETKLLRSVRLPTSDEIALQEKVSQHFPTSSDCCAKHREVEVEVEVEVVGGGLEG
jgi:hypothetical protein